jgi:hypothetical protein
MAYTTNENYFLEYFMIHDPAHKLDVTISKFKSS